MNTETTNTELYEKMLEEQENFRGWLLGQSPEEIPEPYIYLHGSGRYSDGAGGQ